MSSYWLFKQRKDDVWEVLEEDKWSELPEVIAGSLQIVDAKNRAGALATVIGISEVILQVSNDAEDFGSEYAYHKWFGGNEDE